MQTPYPVISLCFHWGNFFLATEYSQRTHNHSLDFIFARIDHHRSQFADARGHSLYNTLGIGNTAGENDSIRLTAQRSKLRADIPTDMIDKSLNHQLTVGVTLLSLLLDQPHVGQAGVSNEASLCHQDVHNSTKI